MKARKFAKAAVNARVLAHKVNAVQCARMNVDSLIRLLQIQNVKVSNKHILFHVK